MKIAAAILSVSALPFVAMAVTLDEDLKSGLSVWMDAGMNVTADAGGNVCEWRDAREESGISASECKYVRAVAVSDYYDYFDSLPPKLATFGEFPGKKFVDFGLLGSDKWLSWRDAQDNTKTISVRSYFAYIKLNGASTAVPVGPLFGYSEGSGNAFLYNGTQFREIYTRGDLMQKALTNAETRIDCKVVSSYATTWPRDAGCHLLSQVGPYQADAGSLANNFGNFAGYHADEKGTGKTGPTYESGNRQGGPIIGEILIYDRCVSDSERRRIEAYLMEKWGGVAYEAEIAVRADETLKVETLTRTKNLSGSGKVDIKGGGSLVIERNTGVFEGTVSLSAGSIVAEQNQDLPALKLVEGRSVVVSQGRMTASSGASLGQVDLTGRGSVVIGSVASGVGTVLSSGVDLSLRSTGDWVDLTREGFWAQGNPVVNGSFETGNFSSWTKNAGSYWGEVLDKAETTYHSESVTGPVPDGKKFAGIAAKNGQVNTELSQTFRVDYAGVYSIRFWHSSRGQTGNVYNSRLLVSVDGTNVLDFTVGMDVRTVGPTVKPTGATRARFLEYEIPTPTLSPGEHTVKFTEVPLSASSTLSCVGFLDDIRILPRRSGKHVWIPDSGFDSWGSFGWNPGTSQLNGDVVEMGGRYHYYSLTPANTSWTFETVDSGISSSVAGLTQDSRFWYWSGHTNEVTRLADHRKAFLLNSSKVSTVVTFPESGTYTFSVRYSKTDWGVKVGDHSCSVKLVGQNGEGTVPVGKFWPKTSETDVYEQTFAVAQPGSYVLSLENTDLPATAGSDAAGRGTVLDDVMIRCGSAQTPGDIASSGRHFVIPHVGRVDVKVALTQDGGHQVKASLVGQALDLTSKFGPYHGYNFYPHWVDVLFDGDKIGRVAVDEPEAIEFAFRIPHVIGGEHTLSFVSDGSASAVFVASKLNGLTFYRLEDEVAPQVDLSGVKIVLADGAKLGLDFPGELTVRRFVVDGVSYSGVVNAQNCPAVSGCGSLKIDPRGLVIIFK